MDCASRFLPARVLRNVPDCESDESSPEVVQVRDPHHPLYGRWFRVIRRTMHRGGNPVSYEVEFRGETSLLISISAIDYYEKVTNQTKLSIEALIDLVSTADCLDAHEHRSGVSLGGVAANTPAPDRRRRRRRPGEDPT